jgi:hypothetical protein
MNSLAVLNPSTATATSTGLSTGWTGDTPDTDQRARYCFLWVLPQLGHCDVIADANLDSTTSSLSGPVNVNAGRSWLCPEGLYLAEASSTDSVHQPGKCGVVL